MTHDVTDTSPSREVLRSLPTGTSVRHVSRLNRISQKRDAFALLLALPAASAIVAATNDVSTINGDIRAQAGQAYGSLATVNGNVLLGRGSRAGASSIARSAISFSRRMDSADSRSILPRMTSRLARRISGPAKR